MTGDGVLVAAVGGTAGVGKAALAVEFARLVAARLGDGRRDASPSTLR